MFCSLTEGVKPLCFTKCDEYDGIGPRVIKQLFEEGLVLDVADLYQLTLDQLLALDKFNKRAQKIFLKQLRRVKKTHWNASLQDLESVMSEPRRRKN